MTEATTKYIVEVEQGLKIQYVLLSWAIKKFLDNNWKLHNAQAIADSFFKYGFRDPIAYDSKLNGGNGGIVEGNGRLENLARCFNDNPQRIPKNVYPVQGVNGDDWAIPMLFGGDAATEKEARQYAIDHNITTFLGGNLSAFDILERGGFDPGIYDELREYAEDGDPIAALSPDDWDTVEIAIANQDNGLLGEGLEDDFEEPEYQAPDKDKYVIAIACDRETYEDWQSLKESIGIKNDLAALQSMMGQMQG